MEGFDFSQYSLPEGSIRDKLDSIRKNDECAFLLEKGLKIENARFIRALKRDSTWRFFDSFHWLVGVLTTAQGITQFVVKGAKNVAGEKIFEPNGQGLPQIHTATQNLSRIRKAEEVNHVINKKGFTNIRTPKMWVYPVSGNYGDLRENDLTDQDVVIVEEMVKKKSERLASIGALNDECQEDTLKIDKETYNQLIEVAQKAGLLDLHPKNFLVDDKGKIVLIDIEDLLASRREAVKRSNPLLRPWKQYKLNCILAGSINFGVGMTGILNCDNDIKTRGSKLLLHGLYTNLITRNIVEILGVTVATTLTVRWLYHVAKTNKRIKNCKNKIRNAIELQQAQNSETSDDVYIEIARKIVTQVAPQENRQEIFEAFVTMALAEMGKTYRGTIKILSVEYKDPEDAVKKSQCTINSIWKSDWSLPCKVARSVKKTMNSIRAKRQKLNGALRNNLKQTQSASVFEAA